MTKKWSDLTFFKNFNEDLKKVLPNKSVIPTPDKVFNAFLFTPRNKVKVLILGQDPYPNPQHAMGLAFSVPAEIDILPPSLANIYKELFEDTGVQKPTGNLVSWAKQGVLLLNTSLTVEIGKPNSHADKGWNQLAREVVETISEENDGLVFILWGRSAYEYKRYIRRPKAHMVIQSAHPSPLSARLGFFGSKPFSKANAFLESCGKEPIRW